MKITVGATMTKHWRKLTSLALAGGLTGIAAGLLSCSSWKANEAYQSLQIAQVQTLTQSASGCVVPGTATVRVQRNGSDLATGSVQVATAAPGLFSADALNSANPGAVLDQDSRPVTDASPARRGSVIQLYASGQGATDPAVEDGAARGPLPPAQSRLVPQVFFAGELAEVLFSGLNPAFPGLWQINVRVPEGAAPGQTPVFVALGSNASNPVTVAVN